MSGEFAIHALNARAVTFLLLAVLLPLLAGGVLVSVISHKAQQARCGNVVMLSVVVLAAVIAGALFWQLSSIRLKMDATTLEVGGGLYRVSLPMAQVERSAVRVWSADDADYVPTWRSNGIGMPGVSLGWFTSKQSKIFAAYAHGEPRVLIPTRAGYVMIVSSDDPQRLVETIRAL